MSLENNTLDENQEQEQGQEQELNQLQEPNQGQEPNQSQEPKEEQKEHEEPKKEVKYSDEDVDKIIQRVIAKERLAKDKAIKELTEAEKMQNMTEEEKASKRMKELEEQIAKLTAENHKKEMATVTRNILNEQGIDAPTEIIDTLISDTAEETKDKVKAFTDTFNTMVEKAVNERLGNRQAPKFIGGETKLSLKDLENLSTADRIKFIQENPDIYK